MRTRRRLTKRKTVTIPRPRRLPFRSSVSSLSVLLLALSLHIPCAHAQSGAPQKKAKPRHPYALVVGTVWGPDDRPVYGVKVKIRRSQDKKAKWELQSDHRGEFAQRFPVGKADYVVWADLKDFKPLDGKPLHAVQEVPVHIDNEERVDISLHLIW